MEDFLRRIKLIGDTSIRLNVTPPEFVSALRNNVEESDIDNLFSSFFEVFSSNNKKFKGEINNKGFYIRKKRKLFKKQYGSTHARGTFVYNGDILVINTVISVLNMNKLLFKGSLFICYLAFIIYYFDDANLFQNLTSEISIPFVLFFIVMIMIVPYFSLKKEVERMKKDLDEYFFLISSKINHSK